MFKSVLTIKYLALGSFIGIIIYFIPFAFRDGMSFITQFYSNFFSAIIAGAFGYFLISKRVQEDIDKRNRIRMYTNMMTELTYNYVTARNIAKNKNIYLTTHEFTVIYYRTDFLFNFLYSRPIATKEGFPYEKFTILISLFENDNKLIDLIWDKNDNSVIENINKVVNNANNLMVQIAKFYWDIEDLTSRYFDKETKAFINSSLQK